MSFSVCSLVRETPDVLTHHVEAWLDAGADRVHLFLDGGPGFDCADPRVTVEICDTDFWSRAGLPENTLENRQAAVFALAHRACETDWMLFCDADEVLSGPGLAECLKAVPPEVPGVRLRNSEAVWGPRDDLSRAFGASWQRWPMPPGFYKPLAPILYGADAALLARGMAGHANGKHLLRRGVRTSRIGNHTSRIAGAAPLPYLNRISGRRIPPHIVHHDAISLDRWAEKWRRRISGEAVADRIPASRRAQMDEVEAALHDGDPARVFRRYYALTWRQLIVLRALGYCTRLG